MRRTVLVVATLVLLTGCSHVVAVRLAPAAEQPLLGALLTAGELKRLGFPTGEAPNSVTRGGNSSFSIATPCAGILPSDAKLGFGVHAVSRNDEGDPAYYLGETIARYEATKGVDGELGSLTAGFMAQRRAFPAESAAQARSSSG
ncbi:hypothetical protein ABZU76_38410 [Amycolatopsis sp. NPDC005232]|uniref:hypothetical protein n=1 Tax=Amycolatopsis sp. NPDC005232 TaxID=3157027 RepID=UPI0033AF60FB